MVKHRIVFTAVTSHDPYSTTSRVSKYGSQVLRQSLNFRFGIQYHESRMLPMQIKDRLSRDKIRLEVLRGSKIVYSGKDAHERTRAHYKRIEVDCQNTIDKAMFQQLGYCQVRPVESGIIDVLANEVVSLRHQ